MAFIVIAGKAYVYVSESNEISRFAYDPNGNQTAASTNRRYYFDFDSTDLINQVIFSSSGNSFEFDNIAVNDPPAQVPEPKSAIVWAVGSSYFHNSFPARS